MKKNISSILENIFSIIILISIIGSGFIFLLFLVSIIIGGEIGNAISLWIKNDFLNLLIRLTTIGVMAGFIKMYITKEHELTMK
ncbi:MAG: hypothetical protein H5T96_04365 [Tissierellales bacterium]|nr:hypothetical protein [Tissierellales bacterium]